MSTTSALYKRVLECPDKELALRCESAPRVRAGDAAVARSVG
eukprot:COSAG01_NODE_2917_length_6859_cov_3.995414_1_plen_42_part_00